MEYNYPYKVYRDGELIMESTEQCRYPRQTELSMLDAGYVIKLHGKRLTKTDLRKEVGRRG